VIDNAPSSEATGRLVQKSFPDVRYVREDRPGLDWARNRAVLEARGEIIAYTDDDVIVDRNWAAALAAIFTESQEVMAVTGLVVPYELETEAQVLFEMYGGFDRGFQRRWAYSAYHAGKKQVPYGTGQFGTGANMAYRRCIFDRIGLFDPALDVGTVTNGGGDLEMFFRVLQEGYVLIYEPRAIVRHRHRREYDRLKSQLHNNGIGLYSYMVRSALFYPKERISFIRFGIWWFWWWDIRRLLQSLLYSSRFPRDLIWSELKGSIIGIGRYFQARRNAAKIISSNPIIAEKGGFLRPLSKTASRSGAKGRAIRNLDLSKPLVPINDISEYESVNVYVFTKDRLHGYVTINNYGLSISTPLLRQLLVEKFGLQLFQNDQRLSMDLQWSKAQVALHRQFMPAGQKVKEPLPDNISIAVIVATYDRPDNLRPCLQSLVDQKINRRIQIIVVDNHPISGLTPPVVAEFADVTLVTEKRKGVSYARNAGILKCSADIIISTDDDVIASSDWIENLVEPFARNDVMAVTGNVIPYELKKRSQQLFEEIAGLGRGFKSWEAGIDWFESFKRDAVPTWHLGGTANVAFRAEIFSHPEIGLFEEMLGPGMPSGVGEDTFMFYKILRAGYSIIYEPKAFIWHKHRESMQALKKQLYNYHKGHVADQLLIFIRHLDMRALYRLIYHLPRWRVTQLYRYFKRRIKGQYPGYALKLILCEIKGNLAGPWGLLQSWRRVRRERQSRKSQKKERKFDSKRLISKTKPICIVKD
jgi:GT2 family glycosyltransferase